MDNYANVIQQLFDLAAGEFGVLASSIPSFDDSKPFDFSDYPNTREKLNEILLRTYGDLRTVIANGINGEWDAANIKNDRLVEALAKTTKLAPDQLEKYSDRNLRALEAFQKRKIDGRPISDRIWTITRSFRDDAENAMDAGLASGKSAAGLARDLKQYLRNPDNRFRRIKDKNGNLIPSRRMKAYSAEPGEYKSSSKNALRLARTEINMAYRTADHERWKQLDFVVGIEILLSNNPNHCSTCVALAGKYPKEFKFVGWHPQCRCTSVPILKTAKEMDDHTSRILQGKEPLTTSANQVLELPNGFKRWMDANMQRSDKAKSNPYFIRDNFKGGKLSGGLKFSTLPDKNPKKAKDKQSSIDLDKLIKGDAPTNAEMRNILIKYSKDHPENFRTGLGKVTFTRTNSFLMQHSGYARNGVWSDRPSDIDISTNQFLSIGFNPAEDLRAGFAAIKAQIKMTFNQEYAFEALWHEILHSATLSPPRQLTIAQTKAMETINQFVARHTYDDFIKAFGGTASNKANILERGYGYRSWISDFRNKLEDFGIPEEIALKELRPVLMSNYQNIEFEVFKFFKKHSKI